MTRDEMIQTVRDAVRNAGTFTTPELDLVSRVAVDALHPRTRNSVPLPDSGHMEWHGGKENPWVRVDGDIRYSYPCLSYHALSDDLHAECYKLKDKEWVEASEEAPTNATPLGFANVYAGGFIARYDTKEMAIQNCGSAVRVAVPLYDHAQTEAELIAALEGLGYAYSKDFIRSWEGPNNDMLRHKFTKRAGGGK